MDNADKVGQRAWELHQAGLHCTEAVCQAVWEAYGGEPSGLVPRAATAFGGGMGRSHDGTCGAVTGGVLALGLLLGRDRPGENWDRPAELASRLMSEFADRHGATLCRDLLETFEPQENMASCKGLTREVAAQVAGMLEQEPTG